jgi:hypothetical protein
MLREKNARHIEVNYLWEGIEEMGKSGWSVLGHKGRHNLYRRFGEGGEDVGTAWH